MTKGRRKHRLTFKAKIASVAVVFVVVSDSTLLHGNVGDIRGLIHAGGLNNH